MSFISINVQASFDRLLTKFKLDVARSFYITMCVYLYGFAWNTWNVFFSEIRSEWIWMEGIDVWVYQFVSILFKHSRPCNIRKTPRTVM